MRLHEHTNDFKYLQELTAEYIGITTVADTLKDAVAASYALTKEVKFDGGFYRNDIGARALKALS